ncbi:ATP-binding cassette domain-containing protein [Corynebacterium diphtheriae bv. mitis]|uniref:ATP-binding cassette domain-containing protein n=1 Tax=Corynebacterium diphtheriae TaxID=1717 RepID=UPI0013C645E8|nr:ATP-binding cassette domain-containing protein [Corynebacterium diphtheriae]MBG9358575.1 sugar ABC transporter ATP-binding protein [Corynebacterium diphtheriae bv. mitis]MBG9360939.1 sugar ABC transporter ATP-binding protein [Corynebacterium diphtheriae bv. mitis]MBG9363157.1 sugar ABC transporter ATP-binding protein [Corynebacterium diphtheriae bv. mitis]MBG9365145.1 sugar ABC transporter ATP-binding protein [Corynebacterium diphtheriae bv. mitis]UWE84109.1 ATP-binding cassette domain-cont
MSEIIALRDVTKSYGSFDALRGVSLSISAGEVLCVLGDNGAGKSTLIKILSGIHKPTSGEMLTDATPTVFNGPRDALNHGIATVHQNLAVVGHMSVWRNFFLGQELTGFLGRLREDEMRRITQEQLAAMGIDLPDVDVEVESLSGGQRQVVAIARAVYFGARVIILDEPTAALGVKQSGMVLRFVAAAREKGIGVVLITHNPHHAYLVGDHFTILNLGNQILDADRSNVTLEELTQHMAGGGELEALSHELRR